MKLGLVTSVLVLVAFGAGCEESSESKDRALVDNQQKLYATTQPVPVFKWSQDRDNLIQIYKMKNEARATYAVVRSQGKGEILWHCPSIGFPLPADTQLTNPLQIDRWGAGASVFGVVEQAEPNGLFSSKNTDGTYVLCVLADGTTSPQYTEAKVEVFTRPVRVKNGQVEFIDGVPSMRLEKKASPPVLPNDDMMTPAPKNEVDAGARKR